MHHQELSFSEYWHILYKRKWFILITFLLFIGMSAGFSYLQEPVFKASSFVRIDQYKSVMNIISDLLRWSPGETMATEVETVQSSIVLGEAAGKLGMIPSGLSDDSPEFHTIVAGLRGKITVERVEQTNMIRIDAVDNTAQGAAKIANTVAEVYREVSNRNKSHNIENAKKFVEEQLDNAQSQLKVSEESLRKFREASGSIPIESETNFAIESIREAEDLDKQLTDIDWKISNAQEKLQIASATSDPEKLYDSSIQNAPSVTAYYNKLVDVRAKINSMLEIYTDSYYEVKDLRAEEKVLKRLLGNSIRAQYEDRLFDLESERARLEARKKQLTYRASAKLRDVPDKDIDYSRITRELKVNEELYNMLSKEAKNTQIKEKMALVSEVTIVSPAIAPKAPVKPNKQFNLIIGALMGILIGIVMAALVETADTSIGAIDDIERLLEVPVLATVPHFSETAKNIIHWGKHKHDDHSQDPHKHSLPTINNPASPEAEAYRHLRTNIQLARLEDSKKVFVVTSSGPQEGKSVTVSNLAVVMSQSGLKTLLISCNLRRPSVCKVFRIKRKPGLTNFFAGEISEDRLIRSFKEIIDKDVNSVNWDMAKKLSGLDNLYIIPAGTLPPNPAEVVDSKKMVDLINRMRDRFDVILIDAPPVLPVADALLLGQKADGVILVYQLGRLPRRALMRTKKLMEGLGIRIVGVTLNDVRPEFQGVTPVYISREYMSATRETIRKKLEAPVGAQDHDDL